MSDTVTSLLGAFTPQVVRLLARTGKGKAARRLTHHEVAKLSGLSYERVRDLSALDSWEKVAIGEADRFMSGCGVNLRNLWRHRAFLRRTLDPRRTARPLAFARRGGAQKPPPPGALVAAALTGARKRRRPPGSSVE